MCAALCLSGAAVVFASAQRLRFFALPLGHANRRMNSGALANKKSAWVYFLVYVQDANYSGIVYSSSYPGPYI